MFRVEERTVSDGTTQFTRSVVLHEGAVAIMAIRDDGRVGMLRQYRATFDNVTWELPAGTRDVPGEDVVTTVHRELHEELGCRAASVTELYRYMNSRGWTDQITSIFVATGLTDLAREPDGPEEKAAEVHWLDDEAMRAIVQNGTVVESSTLIALLHHLGTTR